MSDGQWCTIESDPGVFTELIEKLGVEDVVVEELWTLEDQVLQQLAPVYGLIFLFKWTPDPTSRKPPPASEHEHVYFARQVVPNACATQAILSILLNCSDETGNPLKLGPHLTEFQNISADFPPEMKGLAIGNSEHIRDVHNSFARPEPFVATSSANSESSDEVYHYVSYIPVGEGLYELDGLQTGPILLGNCTQDNWLSRVTPHIRDRMNRCSSSSIHFSLLALVREKTKIYREELKSLAEKREKLQNDIQNISSESTADGGNSSASKKKEANGVDGDGDMKMAGESDDTVSSSRESINAELLRISDRMAQLEGLIDNEAKKRELWKAENIRRRHNYIPFLFNLLKILASKDLLMPMVEAAKTKQNERGDGKNKRRRKE